MVSHLAEHLPDPPINLEQDRQLQVGRCDATQDDANMDHFEDVRGPDSAHCHADHRELLDETFENWVE